MREIHAARKAGVTTVFAVACEKPLCLVPEEGEDLQKVAAESGALQARPDVVPSSRVPGRAVGAGLGRMMG